MPGGFGGGKPPTHRCPRCAWKSEDQLTGSVVVGSVVAVILTGIVATIAFRIPGDLLPGSPIATVVLATFVVGLLVSGAIAAAAWVRRLEHRCPSCGFTWPVFGWKAADAHRARLEAVCRARGFSPVAPEEGELARFAMRREGRSVAVAFFPRGSSLALLAVEHAGRRSSQVELDLARAIDAKVGRHVAENTWSDEHEHELAVLLALPLDMDDLEDALLLLVRAAEELERGTVHVEPRAELHARCAYCHQDLAERATDVVHCTRCSTVLHAGCWDELGRCPVLGCDGTAREGSRARDATC